MLKLHEVNRQGDEIVVCAEGYLTWATAVVLRDACAAFASQGIVRIDLQAEQLRSLDLAALQILDQIAAGGQRVRFHGASGFVQALLTSWGRSQWLVPRPRSAPGEMAPA